MKIQDKSDQTKLKQRAKEKKSGNVVSRARETASFAIEPEKGTRKGGTINRWKILFTSLDIGQSRGCTHEQRLVLVCRALAIA